MTNSEATPPGSEVPNAVAGRRESCQPDSEPHVAVRLTRTGGLAGITRRWQAEAPEGDESQWVAVIDQCPWDETPPTDSVRTDGFTWRIVAVVRHDERSVVLPESAAVGPWATLISVVRDASVG